MSDRFIVAEVSKNWPEEQPKLLAQLFEEVINKNWARGYTLQSWKLHRWAPEPGKLNETIIAIFELIVPKRGE
jgi:hypothetical protein